MIEVHIENLVQGPSQETLGVWNFPVWCEKSITTNDEDVFLTRFPFHEDWSESNNPDQTLCPVCVEKLDIEAQIRAWKSKFRTLV